MSWQVQDTGAYIVRVEFNDTEGAPGTCLYGPFTKEDAEDFAQNWGADDTEIGDVEVLYVNNAAKEAS
jgi:hypothetical protein